MGQSSYEARLSHPVGPRDHVIGPTDAPVTLVEYGDYECPYCRAAHVIVLALLDRMESEIAFCFRHFPITTLHPFAEVAAEAAEAAGVQGKFWAMHDWIYENQETIGPDDLRRAARLLGLDGERFDADLASQRFASRVREDFLGGVRSGVNGTPTFFVNGVRHDGRWDLESLEEAVDLAAAEHAHR
jgi:protein-disulfide isomerase